MKSKCNKDGFLLTH